MGGWCDNALYNLESMYKAASMRLVDIYVGYNGMGGKITYVGRVTIAHAHYIDIKHIIQ